MLLAYPPSSRATQHRAGHTPAGARIFFRYALHVGAEILAHMAERYRLGKCARSISNLTD